MPSTRKNTRPKTISLPDVGLLDGVVHPRIIAAMRKASAQLSRVGIPHALAGGLAVGAYGYPRATKDVDFLVGDEAFRVHGGGVVTINQGVPIAVMDVPVDPMSIGADEKFLRKDVERAIRSRGIPVLPIEALFLLKLMAPRAKDGADLVELLKLGAPVGSIRAYLAKHAPQYENKFASLIDTAEDEC